MPELKLPKLKKIVKKEYKYPVGSMRYGHPVLPKKERKTVLHLGDDCRMHSGIATVTKEIIMNTCHYFNWVNLGGAIKHPDQGKIFDLCDDAEKETGVEDVYVKLYPIDGYGNPDLIRELLTIEKPDAIMHFTDPRFWLWLYQMAPEFNSGENAIPLLYYNIWDDAPPPYWNKPFYESCDALYCISKQTMGLVRAVLGEDGYRLKNEDGPERLVSYIPHGVSDYFFPIKEKKSEAYEKLQTRKKEMFGGKEFDFIIFWNNRNIRRKQPGDLILGYKHFCDKLPKDKANNCLLLMHTQPRDENGTDLPAVVNAVCAGYNVMFSSQPTTTDDLNLMYNLADITVNIASNEGFGLGTCESLRAGTPIIVNVTGGLQDQCGFRDEDNNLIDENYYGDEEWYTNHDGRYKIHGKWVKPVFPSNRSLQGSPATPYIFDDRAKYEDLGEAMYEWYKISKEEREAAGMAGHEFVTNPDIAMTSERMGALFIEHINNTFENFQPRKRYAILK